ncbi:MAG TPA: ATP-binding protein [Chloroflexota bacterium]
MIAQIDPGGVTVPFVPPLVTDTLESHGHTVQFYGEDTFLLEELSRRIGVALGGGNGAVVIATAAHREGLAARLEASGLDLARTALQGRYIAVDAAETLAKITRDGRVDAVCFVNVVGDLILRVRAAAIGDSRHVVAFGEMVALLWEQGQSDTALHLEQLWNDLALTHPFTLYCAYPMRLFQQAADGAALQAICAAHTHVLPTESYATLTPETRLSAITYWQHRAQALETELAAHRRTQEVLRERNEELRAAIAARDVFLSVAAHELKTPITSLQGMAQLLLRRARRQGTIAPDRLMSGLATIDEQASRLRRLLLRLLDSAQIETGKLRIEPIQTDLAALVHAILARHPGQDTHTLVGTGAEHLEAVVDPLRFEQVVVNLLDNAVKFSPEGSTVVVAVEQDPEGGARLSVTDQGVGIAPDQRARVFERFHQAHAGDSWAGLGLGLYITREIIELHGGTVRIEEPAHHGTRFVVTLPPYVGAAHPADVA